jgi:16S rRNA (guanine527-N7)-methyltransferase
VEQPQFVDIIVEGSSILGIGLARQQISQLAVYHRELLRWNSKMNLTAIKGVKEIAVKHFLDSLACSKALVLQDQPSLLDVGSGAGFPGLPLKILHSQLDVTLLEPNEKKTSFLRHVIGTLRLSGAAVISKNLRDFAGAVTKPGKFSHIITRAVSAAQILPSCAALLEEHGRVILCRTKPFDGNPDRYGLKVVCEIDYELPYGLGHRILTVLQLTAAS